MKSVLLVKLTVLHKLKLALYVLPVLAGGVVPPVTFGTLKSDLFNRSFFLACHIPTPTGYKLTVPVTESVQ